MKLNTRRWRWSKLELAFSLVKSYTFCGTFVSFNVAPGSDASSIECDQVQFASNISPLVKRRLAANVRAWYVAHPFQRMSPIWLSCGIGRRAAIAPGPGSGTFNRVALSACTVREPT